MKTLADLKMGQSGKIRKFMTDPVVKRNCMTQGMIKGSSVMLTGKAPFGDPLVFTVNSSKISLRKDEAALILLED